MKVILSRKGVDSEAGGGWSPSFSTGQFLSIPIPYEHSPVTYDEPDTELPGVKYAALVNDLLGLSGSAFAHLDPDLRRGARGGRNANWRPAYGQNGAPLTHLKNQQVGTGDLFIFYGRFRSVWGPPWRYRRHPDYRNGDFHAAFGWLKVGQVVNLDSEQMPDGNEDHPHAHGVFRGGNVVYLAADELGIRGLDSAPGAGVLEAGPLSRTVFDWTSGGLTPPLKVYG